MKIIWTLYYTSDISNLERIVAFYLYIYETIYILVMCKYYIVLYKALEQPMTWILWCS